MDLMEPIVELVEEAEEEEEAGGGEGGASLVRRRRSRLCLESKYNLINDIEGGMRYDEAMKKYRLKNKSNITVIMKRKSKISEEYFRLGSNKGALSVRKSNYPDIEEAVVKWIRGQKSPVNGNMIKSKSLYFAQRLGYSEFKASNGFLSRFKERWKVNLLQENNEVSLDFNSADDWMQKMPQMTAGFEPKDMFAVKETDLYWRLLPNEPFAPKVREKMSLLLLTNATGTERESVLVGRSQKTFWFLGINNIPCRFYSNDSSALTSTIFEDEMRLLNMRMKKSKRKIVLFLNNCPSLQTTAHYSHVKLVYFPDNPFLVNPLSQGVVKRFKAIFRRRVLDQMVNQLEAKNQDKEKPLTRLDLLDAVHVIDGSWKSVPCTLIQSCFNKTILTTQKADQLSQQLQPKVQDEGDSNLDEARILWDFIGKKVKLEYVIFEEFAFADENEEPKELTDEAIIKEIKSREELMRDEDEEENEDDPVFEVGTASEVPSRSEAIKSIQKLRLYFGSLTSPNDQVYQQLELLEKKVYEERMREIKESSQFAASFVSQSSNAFSVQHQPLAPESVATPVLPPPPLLSSLPFSSRASSPSSLTCLGMQNDSLT